MIAATSHRPAKSPRDRQERQVSTSTGARMQEQVRQYETMRRKLITNQPHLDHVLPREWPQTMSTLEPQETVKVLRQALATLNEGLLIIGFGDGSIINHLRADPNGRKKLIHLTVLPEEINDLAHCLGSLPWDDIFSQIRLSMCVARNEADALIDLQNFYGTHINITRLAGTTVIDGHALKKSAAAQRAEWMPHIKKIIVERFDSLGNDVYDTFMGAKHTLMHGDSIMRRARSSDYRNLYKGKSALCIASGPSARPYFEHIKSIQHEHVIICADSIIGGLLDYGIEPDFVTMVERPESMARLVKDHGGRCKTRMFALPVVHPASLEPFGERVAWWWNSDDLYPWIDDQEPRLFSGRSTGTMTAALAGLLGIKTAYLIGHDLAFRNGKTHAEGVAAFTLEDQARVDKDLSRHNPNYANRLIDAQKNGGGIIDTSGVWELFRADLEGLIMVHGETKFINLNINTNEGAVIAGAIAGELPSSTGEPLVKTYPQGVSREDKCHSYRERCLKLLDDFSLIEERFTLIKKKLDVCQPLGQSRSEVEAIGTELDLTTIVSEGNRSWFSYVFRAALRNLMVKLHHNTYVGTIAERNWNQIKVMRLYTESIPGMIKSLRPELEKALESFS